MFYKNQTVLLASKHQKERAIAEAFSTYLGCFIDVKPFDTDQFGTFTGEVERKHSPFETCKLKAIEASKQHQYDLSLASEGSFGPHPSMPFVASDHEILVFIDRKNNWTIAEHLTTTNTNYRTLIIDEQTPLEDFLEKAGFPQHALTLQTNESKKLIAKGIMNSSDLNLFIKEGLKIEQKLLLSTDMRAMMNPTRMAVIKELAQQLAQRIATSCPKCQTPGFGFKNTQGHLPCELCMNPTHLYEKELFGCIVCDFELAEERRDGLRLADSSYCNYCNP